MRSKVFLLGLFFILFSGIMNDSQAQTQAPTLSSYVVNNYIVNQELQKKQFESARGHLLKSLENDPDSLELMCNLAIVSAYQDKAEDVSRLFTEIEKRYLRVVDSDQISTTTKFLIAYNLGVYYGSIKNIEKALKFYQMALDVYPQSVETKHNIELLIDNKSKQNQSSSDQKQDQNQNNDSKDSSNDSKDSKDKKDNQDQKNKSQDSKDNKDNKDKKNDQKNSQDQNSDDQKQANNDKNYQNKPKYVPRPFNGEKLSEGDVKKILSELSQQDKKIRAEYNKYNGRKEDSNGKDW